MSTWFLQKGKPFRSEPFNDQKEAGQTVTGGPGQDSQWPLEQDKEPEAACRMTELQVITKPPG